VFQCRARVCSQELPCLGELRERRHGKRDALKPAAIHELIRRLRLLLSLFLGSGGHCSPRHKIPLKSRNGGSKCSW